MSETAIKKSAAIRNLVVRKRLMLMLWHVHFGIFDGDGGRSAQSALRGLLTIADAAATTVLDASVRRIALASHIGVSSVTERALPYLYEHGLLVLALPSDRQRASTLVFPWDLPARVKTYISPTDEKGWGKKGLDWRLLPHPCWRYEGGLCHVTWALLKVHPGLSAEQVSQVLRIDRRTADDRLARLAAAGLAYDERLTRWYGNGGLDELVRVASTKRNKAGYTLLQLHERQQALITRQQVAQDDFLRHQGREPLHAPPRGSPDEGTPLNDIDPDDGFDPIDCFTR